MKTRKPPLAVLLAYLTVVHLPVTMLTMRDLESRPDDRVRGSKAVWRVLSTLNTAGSVAYWLFGRR